MSKHIEVYQTQVAGSVIRIGSSSLCFIVYSLVMITTKKVFGSYVLTKVDSDKLAAAGSDTSKPNECVIPAEWTDLELLAIRPYNHDTKIFQFALPSDCMALKLPVGGFLLVLAPGCEHDGTDAVRPYTSIQNDDIQVEESTTGTFELLCKRYDQWGIQESVKTHFLFTKTNHSYRPAGAVSNYIHKLKVGQCLKFKRKALFLFQQLIVVCIVYKIYFQQTLLIAKASCTSLSSASKASL